MLRAVARQGVVADDRVPGDGHKSMSAKPPSSPDNPAPSPKRLAFFERYLTSGCSSAWSSGVLLGKLAPGWTASLSRLEFGQGSQVNVPIAVLIWLMIYPMMLKVDFGSIGGIARRPKGLLVTLFVNWLVKPFSMAFFAWLFIQTLFAPWIDPETARNYTAG
jgi:ACR3 family arsenite transporter